MTISIDAKIISQTTHASAQNLNSALSQLHPMPTWPYIILSHHLSVLISLSPFIPR